MFEIAGGIIIAYIVLVTIPRIARYWETKRTFAKAYKVLDVIAKGAAPHIPDFTEIRKKAEAGDAKSQQILGDMYYAGNGVKQDYAQSLKWFHKAAEQGNVDAQYGLGSAYDNGLGTKQDYKEAMKWYRMAAEQGDADAQSGLGLLYYEGKGITQDFEQSYAWFSKSANKNTTAKMLLGALYYEGNGVPQNFEEAYFWLTLSLPENPGSKGLQEKAASQLTPQQITNVEKRITDLGGV
ncbi:MAG: sel1 repeat family protein [Pseudomonadota bacterium]|nr:sel1 repeat family protein [Pseudomonadota bacterium]MDE3037407.1 sel1 repeat family protein [Pseudomonadota bacterium]